MLTVAAVLGNVCGYWIGRLIGPPLFNPRTGLMGKIFKQSYVAKTHEFFEQLRQPRADPGPLRADRAHLRHPGRRRRQMDFRKFITYTAIGGVLWACGVTTLGYYLGTVPFIQDNLEAALILIVLHLGDPDAGGVRAAQAAGPRRHWPDSRGDADTCPEPSRAAGRAQPTCRPASAARIGGRNCGALSGMVP